MNRHSPRRLSVVCVVTLQNVACAPPTLTPDAASDARALDSDSSDVAVVGPTSEISLVRYAGGGRPAVFRAALVRVDARIAWTSERTAGECTLRRTWRDDSTLLVRGAPIEVRAGSMTATIEATSPAGEYVGDVTTAAADQLSWFSADKLHDDAFPAFSTGAGLPVALRAAAAWNAAEDYRWIPATPLVIPVIAPPDARTEELHLTIQLDPNLQLSCWSPSVNTLEVSPAALEVIAPYRSRTAEISTASRRSFVADGRSIDVIGETVFFSFRIAD